MYVFLVRFDANEVSTDGIEASSDCHIDIQQTTSWTVHHDTEGTVHNVYFSGFVCFLFCFVFVCGSGTEVANFGGTLIYNLVCSPSVIMQTVPEASFCLRGICTPNQN